MNSAGGRLAECEALAQRRLTGDLTMGAEHTYIYTVQ